MAQILFPQSHAPGKDAVEGAGSLVNAYAEPLQEGGPSGHVIRRSPGLTTFATSEEVDVRGIWFNEIDTLYVAYDDTLVAYDSAGSATSVGDLQPGALTFLGFDTDLSNLTTYTFSSFALGSADSERRIVVAVYFSADDDSPPASVTVGGVTATAIANSNSGIALYIAKVPTGTSGDIVIEYATGATAAAICAWRVGGLTSNTAYASDTADGSGGSAVTATVAVPAGGVVIAAANIFFSGGPLVFSGSGLTSNLAPASGGVDISFMGGLSGYFAAAQSVSASAVSSDPSDVVLASWDVTPVSGGVTFAKNNASTPDQVLAVSGGGAYSFTTAGGLSSVSVNSEIVTSVCFGESYFFFTTPGGLCYASNVNSTTVTGTDYIRTEARAEPLVRGVFYSGELFLFGETHTEVWASNGNPNATGFPLNRTTVIWRGLIGLFAVCGFEAGFEGQLVWVADDNSVRILNGYNPQVISTPDLERDIEDCASKSTIRCWVYDIDGHACVGVHIPGIRTWVYDLSTGFWHIRTSLDAVDCRIAGNSVKAFGKWIAGDTDSGNLFQIDDTSYNEVGDAMTFEVESIAMEAFPTRLQVSRADFNFVGGVGTSTVDDPMVKISWSDDGGHTWSDPVSRKLGEAGRYLEQVRVNRVGLTKQKGRRWRLQVSDEVYVGLLGGSMEVQGRT